MPQTKKADYAENIARLKAQSQTEPVSSFLDIKLEELEPGYARLTMPLKPEYENFNRFVFGGIIMSLADEAFGYAVNSMSYPTVATQFNIHFIAAAGSKDRLTAEGRVIRAGRRAVTCEMTVSNQEGKLIAKATGTSIPLGRNG